jgi:hypothetical protein
MQENPTTPQVFPYIYRWNRMGRNLGEELARKMAINRTRQRHLVPATATTSATRRTPSGKLE